MGPAGLIAILAGWTTTEVGRQPWVVYGVLRTADAVSPHGAATLGLTLVLFVVAYIFVFGTGTVYLLRMIRKGPQRFELNHAAQGGPGEDRTPMRPLSAADVRNDDNDDDQGPGAPGGQPRDKGQADDRRES
jgi:cytochrome d ubiquinol oxidase subunit I